MHRPGGRGRRVRAVAPVVAIFFLAGCVGVRTADDPAASAPSVAVPSVAPASAAPVPPSAAPSAAPTPTPGPTPRTYRVRPGDTLSGIAAKLKRSVDQVITANAWIIDPDRLEVGQVLIVPDRDAPSDGGPADQAIDGIDDLVDADGAPVEGDLLADLASLRVGLRGKELVVLLDLGSVPPRRVTPEVERIAYAAVIDTDDDDVPDWRLTWATGADGRFTAGLEDLAEGSVREGDRFPGSVTFEGTTLVWSVRQSALGDGLRYRVAANVERGYRAGGKRDAELVTIDRVPDQSWPLPNPRWYEIGVPGG